MHLDKGNIFPLAQVKLKFLSLFLVVHYLQKVRSFNAVLENINYEMNFHLPQITIAFSQLQFTGFLTMRPG